MATQIATRGKSGKATETSLKEIRRKKTIVISKVEEFENKDKKELFEELGLGTEYFVCHSCGKVKRKDEFYQSTEPNCKTGVTSICKECARDIAIPVVNGEATQPTKETVDDALFALNKPFLDSVWESSLLEAANTMTGKTKNNVWTSYIKNISMPPYYGMTYRNSDNYNGGILSIADMTEDALPKDQEIIQQFEKNKNDALKLLGYLPFEKEKLADQPFLYAQLIGFLDSSEEGNEDMMRTSSIISIVRGFLQQNTIDDMIADLVRDPRNAEKNIASVKALQEMKKNITASVTKLAEQSCISLKNNKGATKGSNTWTDKIKKLKDMNLRDAEVNGFDIATCKAMRQVMDASNASIMKQLKLDESEYSDMIAQQRELVVSLTNERDSYQEISRVLLRENLDLRNILDGNGLLNNIDLVNLDDLYSPFASSYENNKEEGDD